MDDAMLRADCTRCTGLCCVALAFDRGPLFAEDKPAGAACRHLGAGERCTVHARRAALGYAGCAAYDCHGAGQAATQLFSPLSWRDSPAAARAMFGAFGMLREIHQLAALAAGLQRCELADVVARLVPPDGWSYAQLLSFARSPEFAALRVEVARWARGRQPV